MTTPGWPTPRSCPTRRARPCAGFITRAAAYFAASGIDRIERALTDNHWSYRRSTDVAHAIRAPGATHKFISHSAPGEESAGWTTVGIARVLTEKQARTIVAATGG
jgi:hypothetical protein